jgi:hypothetical protein
MSVIRVAKTDCFAQIPNATLQDKSISLEAKGLLCFMLSKPTNWTWHKSQVMTETGCGRDRFNRLWKELVNAGYLHKERREGQNLNHFNYILYDLATADFQGTGFQAYEVQGEGSDTPTKTDVKKTDVKNTDLIIESSLSLVSQMQEIRESTIGDKFPETKAQRTIMAVLVRQHGQDTVGKVMEWAMADSFWASIIITPTMLHKHFGKLKLQSSRSETSTKSVYERYLENHPEEDES